MSDTAWMAPSTPHRVLEHSWAEPHTASATSRVTKQTDLPITLRSTSPIPVGLIPGHLSRAIRRLAKRPRRRDQSMMELAIQRARLATQSRRRRLADPYQSKTSCQWDESHPSGPALPWIRWMAIDVSLDGSLDGTTLNTMDGYEWLSGWLSLFGCIIIINLFIIREWQYRNKVQNNTITIMELSTTIITIIITITITSIDKSMYYHYYYNNNDDTDKR